MTEERSLDQNFCADVLYKLAITLASQLNLCELYNNLVNIGCELAETPHGFLTIVDIEHDTMEQRFGTGVYARYTGNVYKKSDPCIPCMVWDRGRILLVNNEQWVAPVNGQPDNDRIKTILGIPLYSGYDVIAVIGLGFEDARAGLTNEQIDLLSRCATLAALALNNARLYNSLNTELLVQKQVNKVQKTIMEQQINLYYQQLMLAQGAKNAQVLSSGIATDHYALARRMRRTTQMQLADIYMGTVESMSSDQKTQEIVESLTPREQIVLCFIASGLSNQEIARQMGITVNTVKTHVSHLFEKLRVNRRGQALLKARELGLLAFNDSVV